MVTGVDNGSPSSFEFASGNKFNFRLAGGAAFEISDSRPAITPYFDSLKLGDIIPNPHDLKSFYTEDSPGYIVIDPGGAKLIRVNIMLNVRTYLTSRYTDNSLYSLAYLP